MSIVLNMVGGGGSLRDTDAVLLVTVPTGSTVTATKGAVTLTPTIWTTNADNTLDCALFSIPSNTFDSNAWTVTASLGTDTTSNTIVIDSAEEYEMTLSYALWLYKDGVNNGLVQGRFQTYTQGTVSFDSLSVKLAFAQISSGSYCSVVITSSPIDLTEFSTLHILVDVVRRPTTNGYNSLGLSTTSPTYTDYYARTVLNNSDLLTGENEYTLDVSSYSNSFYVLWDCKASGSTNNSLEAYIKRMWLTR